MFLFAAAGTLSSCNPPATSSSVLRDEQSGLIVEFRVICWEGNIALESTLTNSNAHEFRIETGMLPWEDAALGAKFRAFSNGKELEHRIAAPITDRFGAIVLAPNSQQTGIVPLYLMFPEAPEILRDAPLTVHWEYAASLGTDGPMNGSGEINRNPCPQE